MADPQNPVKTTGMALNGKHLLIDEFKDQKPLPKARDITVTSAYHDYVPEEEIDYTDLASVNRQLVALRMRMHHVRKDLAIADRVVVSKKWAFEGEKKRAMISLSGGTEKVREAAADLIAEDAYSEFLVAQEVAKEIAQHNRDLRGDLDLLKEISNNLRRIIDLQ